MRASKVHVLREICHWGLEGLTHEAALWPVVWTVVVVNEESFTFIDNIDKFASPIFVLGSWEDRDTFVKIVFFLSSAAVVSIHVGMPAGDSMFVWGHSSVWWYILTLRVNAAIYEVKVPVHDELFGEIEIVGSLNWVVWDSMAFTALSVNH